MGRMNDLVERFRADCEIRNIRATEIYVLYAQEFSDFKAARGKNVLNASKDDFKDFLIHIRERGIKQSTVERIFTCISSFYTFLVDEEMIASNPVLPFKRLYLRKYKEDSHQETRQIISIEQASLLANSILDSRDKAIVALLLKTGMRSGELCSLDADDVDLKEMQIRLKPTAKRSNRLLFFDHETAMVLETWLAARTHRNKNQLAALFPSKKGNRICNEEIDYLIKKYASHVGLHDPSSKKLEDRFTPHCCRHWFTTHIIRAGMPRDFVKELRGDVKREGIDIYNHIDKKELKESYLAHIPQLGI